RRAQTAGDFEQAAEDDVERIFNKEFREELRNRGRLHFEKILGENAMFLQQDLRLTTSQLNDYMKTQVTGKLQETFNAYAQSIADTKQMAVHSLKKVNQQIEAQGTAVSQSVEQEVNAKKAALLKNFEQDMAKIVEHYVTTAVGEQLDLSNQLDMIIG